jgi:hypothetical protein
MTYTYCCVQCWTPDNGQRNFPKHVDFYSKIKSERLVHLVGFILRMYHAARSSECQMTMQRGMRRYGPTFCSWLLTFRHQSITFKL